MKPTLASDVPLDDDDGVKYDAVQALLSLTGGGAAGGASSEDDNDSAVTSASDDSAREQQQQQQHCWVPKFELRAVHSEDVPLRQVTEQKGKDNGRRCDRTIEERCSKLPRLLSDEERDLVERRMALFRGRLLENADAIEFCNPLGDLLRSDGTSAAAVESKPSRDSPRAQQQQPQQQHPERAASSATLPPSQPIPEAKSAQKQKKQQKQQQQRDDEESKCRFTPSHEKKWYQKLSELRLYRKQHGHCLVPHTYPPNPQLARWVKRQRRQYKLMQENKPSTMTPDRVHILELDGFVWDSHEAAWREKVHDLRIYRAEHGNTLVPSNYAGNPQLATWVKCQRRQYKLYWEGKPSAMNPGRIAELEKEGFRWELRFAAAAASRRSSNKGSGAKESREMPYNWKLNENERTGSTLLP